jgi:predicted RNA methylase
MRHELKIILLIISIMFLSSCEKDTTSVQDDYFKVKVLGKGIDCGDVYLVEFIEKLEKVELITESHRTIYYGDDLPDEFKQDSILLQIKFRQPMPEELYPCTTLGPGYPHIRIISVRR